ncbi:hypothetical protein GCM10010919_29020 [Alishewanella longhuensis]|uniref:DJ-1/PfpI domain-containing protein n=1 Tax=Alishewanella longhuensis TaxID=1091037 RepID=A0ABQ3L1D0_9ALTE|nr:DJ-1/PfpI family protein [Alishewanella longhuensis]GHG75062.1 hypothetical protein GCM10010919_29020 [Alishewanella longhuensis]
MKNDILDNHCINDDNHIFNVFFLLGDATNVMDTAGPWEVFQDANLFSGNISFQLHTISTCKGVLLMSGGFRADAHFSINDFHPSADIVVVPAQKMDTACQEWLIAQATAGAVILSVCTGAFHLARAGLLARRTAATHHDFWQKFSDEFPNISLSTEKRFIDNGQILCAGGLTSGIDAALYLLARICGEEAATRTGDYLEHQSKAWQQQSLETRE